MMQSVDSRRPSAAICLLFVTLLAGGCTGETQAPATKSDQPVANQPYGGKPEFDPVAMNGPIFEDWAPPRLALVLTGAQLGYLEPCGCAGLENQKGGLSRRLAMIRERAEEHGWPTMQLDAGGQVRRVGAQAEIKFHTTIDALRAMDVQAVGVGPEDLRLPSETLIAAALNFMTDEASHITCANVALLGFEEGITSRHRVVGAGGVTVGVTAVLADRYVENLPDDGEIVSMPASEALAQVAPQLDAEAEICVLLAYADEDEAAALAREFPQFDVVVVAEGGDEPPHQPATIEGQDTILVEVGHKGMYAAVVGIYDDPAQPLRYQRVPLDSRFSDSPEIYAIMEGYQQQLESLGFSGLGLAATPHPRSNAEYPLSGEFIGAARCGECHKKAHEKWSTTRHSRATESLLSAKPPRQFDPECLSCHVTGWNAQAYHPYDSGYQSLAETRHLAANGCENCHGPGAAHAAAEEARGAERDILARDQLREAMRLTKSTAEEQLCVQCHDPDNSPDFEYARYWREVEHKGKD